MPLKGHYIEGPPKWTKYGGVPSKWVDSFKVCIETSFSDPFSLRSEVPCLKLFYLFLVCLLLLLLPRGVVNFDVQRRLEVDLGHYRYLRFFFCKENVEG